MQTQVNNGEPQKRVSIQSILRQTPDLPAMPAALIKVLQATDGSDSNARLVAQAVSMDQSLSARVLRMANSSFYGLSRKVTTLQEAVVLLGFRSVRQLALLAGTQSWLSRPLPGYDLAPKALMVHSFSVATGAQMIAKLSKYEEHDTVFVTGLLADIGKIALSNVFDGKLQLLVQLGIQAGMTFDQVERHVIGVDHAEVGAHLAESWNLPQDIIDGIRWHHMPSHSSKNQAIADCIHIADFMAMSVGCGLGGDGLLYEFDEESLQRRGISSDDLDKIIDDFVIAFEAFEAVVEELTGE